MRLKALFQKKLIEAGCDEAGRGCLAGPVVAASVILGDSVKIDGLDDSKKLTEKQREEIEPEIKQRAAAFGIGIVDNREIDEINILNASFLAMHRAIDELTMRPEFLIIDGNRFNPYLDLQHECIIKGDGKYLSIAAASILAKVERDRIMKKWHLNYPDYDWDHNKGYPTPKHRKGIEQFGATPLHRKSFKLLPDKQLELDF
jgi:ribonuclease HII